MVPLKINLSDDFLEEENRCNYKVSKKMKEVFAVELDLLYNFQNVCNKYGLKYFADGGTLLGCVRHKGFIPWDDDIDIGMPREDYEKFCDVAKKEFVYPYFLQTEESEKGSLRFVAKLHNCNTTMILSVEENRKLPFTQGICIDIFPFDNIPDDENERDYFFKKIIALKDKARHFNCLSYRYNYLQDNSSRIKVMLKRTFAFFIKTFKIKNFYYYKLNLFCKRYNKTQTKCFGSVQFDCGKKDPYLYKKDSYKNTTLCDFEMLKLPIPKYAEDVLSACYGDWKTFSVGTSLHGDVILDTDNSYKSFLEV